MISADKVRYEVVALTGDGTKLQITQAMTSGSYEEGEKELAVRANFTLANAEYQGKLLTAWMPLCTRIYVLADWGAGTLTEVFRGSIWEHKPEGKDEFQLTVYDEMYYLQKSEEARYFAKGTSFSSMITKIFSDWGIKMRTYKGPGDKHKKKLILKTMTIAAAITKILDKAKDITDIESMCRMVRGEAEVVPINSNSPVYLFDESNSISIKQNETMVNLVTKIIVYGKQTSKGKPKVQATLTGKTEYGTIQRVYNRGSDSLATAKKEAKKILKDDGKPKKRSIIMSVDVPCLRKGDRVYVRMGLMDGYATIKSIAHDMKQVQMRMEVEEIEQE